MISDWSGAALEFAFALKKPIIFCDTQKKVNNPKYSELKIEPIEVALRQELGVIWDCISPIEETIKKLSFFKSHNISKLERKFTFGEEIGSIALKEHIENILRGSGIVS